MKHLRSILFSIFLAAHGQSAYADGAPLLQSSGFMNRSQETTLLAKSDATQIQTIRARPETTAATAVSIDPTALLSSIATVAVPGNGLVRITKTREERASATDTTWFGKTDSGGTATFVVKGLTIYGMIRDSGKIFELRKLGDKFHVLIEIDNSRFPPGDPPTTPDKGKSPSSAKISSAEVPSVRLLAATSSTIPNINILVAYTPQSVPNLWDNCRYESVVHE
jgi:hypothetical protein